MAITCLLLDRKHRILGVLLEVVNGDGRDVFCEHKPHTSLSLSLSLRIISQCTGQANFVTLEVLNPHKVSLKLILLTS